MRSFPGNFLNFCSAANAAPEWRPVIVPLISGRYVSHSVRRKPAMPDQPRRPRTLNDARTEAEAAFRKTTTKVAEAPPQKAALPGVKELVSLRIDQDVLEHFQQDGPGWQDRINEALRKAVGK